MTDVWDRLINAFFEFRDAKGYYAKGCNEYYHYRDEVVSEDFLYPRAAWYLHGNKIAELKRTENGLYVLKLSNAGYDTPTTISRLNLIVREAYERYMYDARDAPWFRLKYRSFNSSPIATYVEYQGKTFLLTGRKVKITFFPGQRRADVDIYGREILFFKDAHEPDVDRMLRRIRKLYWETEALLEKISDVDEKAEKLVENRFRDTLEIIEGAGLGYHGLFVEHIKEPEYSLIVNTLRSIRDTLRLIYTEDSERIKVNAMMLL